MKRRDLIRHMKANDSEYVREGGNHTIYRNEKTGRTTVVPRHREIDEDMVHKICKELGIPKP